MFDFKVGQYCGFLCSRRRVPGEQGLWDVVEADVQIVRLPRPGYATIQFTFQPERRKRTVPLSKLVL